MELSYREMNFEDDQVNFGEQPNDNWKKWISNRKSTLVLLSAVAILVLACTIVLNQTVLNAEHSDEVGNENYLNRIKRKKMLKYLHQVSSTKACISGVHCQKFTYDTLQNSSKITNAFPGVVSASLRRYIASSTEWKIFIEDMIFIWNNRHLVKIFWWGHSPFWEMEHITFKPSNMADRERKWNELMLEGSFLNTKWKEQLDFVAPHLLKLQPAGVVPILDILPKTNKKSYDLIWSGCPGVNGSAKFYKMTQDYLKQKHNFISVIWVWSVDQTVMGDIEQYWPGGDYVDVVSVYLDTERQLTTNQYQKLVNVVGDKPMSMELMDYVPSTQLLAAQPWWTWFTVAYLYLPNKNYNPVSEVHSTFHSIAVINAENITYFDNAN